ncbi:hypothetical protein BV898_02708 [Hypsibius exemplaris]|uniref:BZIP domain-containing protein n=1 Tax=Hypsibius exemplaris TaxID=2072580 RepID=A0A1W0X8J1_HYPEX|nr:hypothetical protein BV898_02708 [Hypsibius exemplaris]
MSVNVRNHFAGQHIGDPFLGTGKSEPFSEDRYSPFSPQSSSSNWGSPPPALHSYPSHASDQYCPSLSVPNSPACSVAENLTSYYDSHHHHHQRQQDFEEFAYIKDEEPYEDFFLNEPFGLPPLSAESEVFSQIYPLEQDSPEGSGFLEERYQDFMQIFDSETSPLSSSPISYSAFAQIMDELAAGSAGGESTEEMSMSTTPAGSIASESLPQRSSARSRAKKSSAAAAKKSPSTPAVLQTNGKKKGRPATTDFSGMCAKLNQFSAGNGLPTMLETPSTSRRPSVTASVSASMSTSDEDSVAAGSHQKQTYTRRREKNNIAVRKSREKKRQEIKKFADEHVKLKREVDHIRAQNERLKQLVTVVEDGIVGEKSRAELEALIKTAKKQLHWC